MTPDEVMKRKEKLDKLIPIWKIRTTSISISADNIYDGLQDFDEYGEVVFDRIEDNLIHIKEKVNFILNELAECT